VTPRFRSPGALTAVSVQIGLGDPTRVDALTRGVAAAGVDSAATRS
jgi:hypothetical protein